MRSARLLRAAARAEGAARPGDAAPPLPPTGSGTVVFAWTAHDLLDRAGLVHVARCRDPFRGCVLLDPGFAAIQEARTAG